MNEKSKSEIIPTVTVVYVLVYKTIYITAYVPESILLSAISSYPSLVVVFPIVTLMLACNDELERPESTQNATF